MALIEDNYTMVSYSLHITESDVEEYLVKRCAACGFIAEKFTSPGKRSVPDRVVLRRNGNVFFVECKAPGKKPTDAQARDHNRRRARGFKVYVVDSFASVNDVMNVEIGYRD